MVGIRVKKEVEVVKLSGLVAKDMFRIFRGMSFLVVDLLLQLCYYAHRIVSI